MNVIAGNKEFRVSKVHFYNGMNIEIFGEHDEMKALYDHLITTRLSEERIEESFTKEKEWIGSVFFNEDDPSIDLYIKDSLWYWLSIRV